MRLRDDGEPYELATCDGCWEVSAGDLAVSMGLDGVPDMVCICACSLGVVVFVAKDARCHP